MLDDGFGMEATKVTQEGRVMDGVEQGQSCRRRDIHVISEVKVAIIEGPVFEGRTGEKGGSVCKVGKGAEYEGVGGGRRFNVSSESEVQGVDDNWFGNNGSVDII